MSVTSISIQISDKPSEAIRQAIADLEEIEKDPRYTVDMSAWHEPGLYDLPCCSVCLAGAVMARAGAPRNISFLPRDFPESQQKLLGLDWFRGGNVNAGLSFFGIIRASLPDIKEEVVDVPLYHEDADAFKRAMLALASDLEKAGA